MPNLPADDRQIIMTRLIPALPDKVWRAFTDPTLLPRWFGPDGFTCKTKEINLVEGGQWRFDMIAPDGTIYPNRHRYTRQTPTTRLEFLMDDDSDTDLPMQVEITLTAESGGTRLTQTITFPNTNAKTAALSFGADVLGQQTLGKLATLVATL
ncbi:MAG: SRPBCC domain-containing protein [Paracoccaceae bacterium]